MDKIKDMNIDSQVINSRSLCSMMVDVQIKSESLSFNKIPTVFTVLPSLS